VPWAPPGNQAKENFRVITFNFLVFLQIKEGIQYHLRSKVAKQRETKK